MEDRIIITATTFLAALFLALIYILGGHLRFATTHRRRWLSLAAGVATAYVFVHLLPELYEAQEAFTRSAAGRNLPFAERRIYLSALIGFVVMYGLEHMVASSKSWEEEAKSAGREDGSLVYWLHVGGFCIYSGIVSYVMIRESEGQLSFLVPYFIAMAFHFLATDHSLRREHGSRYDRSGKWLMAAGIMLGWALGITGKPPGPTVVTLMGFIGGGVVINSLIGELPGEKEGRFWYFFAGAIGYALVLLLI